MLTGFSQLGRDLQLDGNNAANIQQKDAQQNKGLIIITTLVSTTACLHSSSRNDVC